MKIDGRQQQDETSALLKPGITVYTRRTRAGLQVQYLQGKMRSWVAWCFVDIFILELVSNQLTVPVKIGGRSKTARTNASTIENRRSYMDYKHAIIMRMRSDVVRVI